MDYSHAEQLESQCPHCQQSLKSEIRVTIDADARPELIARLEAGSLHEVACPHCGKTSQPDVPLLVVRQSGEPLLLFSPARRTSAEDDQRQAAELLAGLRQRLGERWPAAWGTQAPVVPRDIVGMALQQGLAPTANLQRRRQQAVEELQAFIQCASWNESHECLKAHPALLEDLALDILRQFVGEAERREDEQGQRAFREHLDLLTACRERGPEAAFAAKLNAAEDGIPAPPQCRPEFEVAMRECGAFERTGQREALDRAVQALGGGRAQRGVRRGGRPLSGPRAGQHG